MTTPAANPSPSLPRRAGFCPSCWLLLLSVLMGGVGLDLVTKDLAFELVAEGPVILDRAHIGANPGWHLQLHEGIVVVPRLLNLKLVVNRGAVFGVGPGQRWFFVAFTCLAVAVGVGLFALRTRQGSWQTHVAIALVLSGAIGNLHDRIRFTVVRDFFYIFPDVHLPFGLRWPGGNTELFPWVFNVADVLLLMGIGLLVLWLSRDGQRHRVNEQVESTD